MYNFLARFKRKSLSDNMFFNYVVLFFLIILVSILTAVFMSFIVSYSQKNIEQPRLFANQVIREDDLLVQDVLKIDGWVEVLDSNFKVVKTYGGSKQIGYTYSREEFFKLVFSNDGSEYYYSSAYLKGNQFIVLSAVPLNKYKEGITIVRYDGSMSDMNVRVITQEEEKAGIRAMAAGIAFFIIILGLGILAYSKLTSRILVKPLRTLLQGVRKIQAGDYSVRIALKSVSEIGQLKDAFNHMVMKIQEEILLRQKSEEARKHLIMSVSHDLKNPLASIVGYAGYLMKNENLSGPDKNKYLKVIYENGLRANDLIQDLLQFSKLDSEDFSLSLKKMDLCEFMRELLAGYIPQIEEKCISYDLNIPEESIFALFDSKQLDRAISNLIVNAIKYNDAGTTIAVRLKQKQNRIQIVIEDNGIGIPRELAEDVFKPFIRVDSARNSKTGGSGLGLSITKRIIAKHGWDIRLDKSYTNGCRFIIELTV